MALILHHAGMSSASRKVRLALHEKDVVFEGCVMDLARFEHHEGWSKVPTWTRGPFGVNVAVGQRRRSR